MLLAAVVAASLCLQAGGTGTMNILLASVTEGAGEVGIRPAIAATASGMLRRFPLETVTRCCVGGIVRIPAPSGPRAGVAKSTQVPFSFNRQINAIAPLVSAAAGVSCGDRPAGQPAEPNPIDTIRHE